MRSQAQEEFEKRMEEIGGTGHPPDAEWFCKEHADAAAKYRHLTLAEAWPKIKEETAGGQVPPTRQDSVLTVQDPTSPPRPRSA